MLIIMMIMHTIDNIMALIHDSQWHGMDEIHREFPIPEEKLDKVLCFLQDYDFINKENQKLKITPAGLKFLKLPN